METTGPVIDQPNAESIVSQDNVLETQDKMMNFVEDSDDSVQPKKVSQDNEIEEGPIDSDEQLEEPDANHDPLIEIDGEKKTAKEWKEGYMKAQDYTRKTQELATKRKELEAKEQRTSQMQEAYAATLGLLTKAAKDDVGRYANVDWQRMANEAPAEYIRHQAAYNEAIRTLRETEAEAQEFFSEVKDGLQQKEVQKAHYAKQELVRTFKGWTNDLYYKLIDYGVKNGMDRGFLMNATDPTLFKTLYKSRAYDLGRAVNTAPKTQSPSKSMNNRGFGNKAVSGAQKAMDRLRETGDTDAAQDVMMAFI